jgi:hypothetical protein
MAAEASGAWLRRAVQGRVAGRGVRQQSEGAAQERVSRVVVVQDNEAEQAARAGCGRVDARANIRAGGTTVPASQGAGQGSRWLRVPT